MTFARLHLIAPRLQPATRERRWSQRPTRVRAALAARRGRAGARAERPRPAAAIAAARPTTAIAAARSTGDVASARVRAAGGPTDEACYSCSCGFVFRASVSTTVACPHCGAPQAW